MSSTAATVTEKASAQGNDRPQAQQVALRIHQMVNEERARHGLPDLLWDDRIATFAEVHSGDIMVRDNYAEILAPKDKGDIFYRGIENVLCINEMNQQCIE